MPLKVKEAQLLQQKVATAIKSHFQPPLKWSDGWRTYGERAFLIKRQLIRPPHHAICMFLR